MNLLLDKYSFIRYFSFGLAIIMMVTSIIGLSTKGLNYGIDFTGGFLTEFSTSLPVERTRMQQELESILPNDFILTTSNDSTHWTLREPPVTEDHNHTEQTESHIWLEKIQEMPYFKQSNINIEWLDSDFMGSQIGQELKEQGGLALLTTMLLILLYLAFRFEWRFSVSSIFALFHDVTIVLGVFAWTQVEFNLTVLASLLAIIGYSLNDSIIIADRIRELMMQNSHHSLSKIINLAIQSTITRTLITSGTTLATIASIGWLAGESMHGFSLALFVGILVGTLSSICISATLPEFLGLSVDYYKKRREEAEAFSTSP
ncbi:protein translocase subunit SecF [Pleionea sediminis]|uniref:protein translocase subunit SecF n=1 Tax=Pleionea sediminis TaxID=2569479 RepID=UPI0011854944|nr:protein translocase subunit SecF [Pleionea sediminis]